MSRCSQVCCVGFLSRHVCLPLEDGANGQRATMGGIRWIGATAVTLNAERRRPMERERKRSILFRRYRYTKTPPDQQPMSPCAGVMTRRGRYLPDVFKYDL